MNKNDICFVVGAAKAGNSYPVIEQTQNDIVIAADGGFKHAEKMNFSVDLIVGDFDSIGVFPSDIAVERHAGEKNETDLFLAVNRGIEMGYSTFVIANAIGGERLDHTAANMQICAGFSKRGVSCYFFDDDCVMTGLFNGRIDFSSDLNGYISIFAHDNQAVVTYKNLKYDLKEKMLENDFPLGVSNEFCGLDSFVKADMGSIIVIWQEEINHLIRRIRKNEI